MDKDKLALNKAEMNGAQMNGAGMNGVAVSGASGQLQHQEHFQAGHDDGSGAGVVLDARIQDAIGRSLKAHYDDLVSAPIPDKFLMLLAELEAKEQQHGN